MKKVLLLIAAVMLIGIANAGTPVTSNITTSAHWTQAGSPYTLVGVIYVEAGATLRIDPGVVVATYEADDGSLAVCRGAKLFVEGTQDEPVIFTSAEDVATWTGSVVTRGGAMISDGFGGTIDAVTSIDTMGDPKTGVWREACNEWGSIAIMGKALTSGSHYGGLAQTYQDGYGAPIVTNSKLPDGLTKKQMEGLDADLAGDPKVLYGGSDDNDDSGSISYLSIRYAGKQGSDINKELNGLSLGGVGRGTDIHHVEITNNIDDGIEIWGGTVELEYVNIWNVGDDSFDLDQGWRGKASHGLIVQGYSVNASQGSGVGDNAFEHDGAEDSDAQPVTTALISNFTVVGQPVDGDHGTAWRDNARIQYRNCIWMDLGEDLVKLDNVDGDGAQGYGYNGTLSWADTWTTAAGTHSTVNAISPVPPVGSFNHPDTLYTAQDTSGKLAQITNSVFYNNLKSSAYTTATAVGVFDAANNNTTSTVSPIQGLTRGAAVTRGGKIMVPVTSINPCAAGDALTKGAGAFTGCYNWLAGWTAADAYGMTDTSNNDLADFDCDGSVNLTDLSALSADWLM